MLCAQVYADSPCEFGSKNGHSCNDYNRDLLGSRRSSWHMYAITYQCRNGRSDWVFYWDGKIFETNIQTGGCLRTQASNMRIGAGESRGAAPFRGQIDDVAYFNTALSAGDIAAIWNDGKGVSLRTARKP